MSKFIINLMVSTAVLASNPVFAMELDHDDGDENVHHLVKKEEEKEEKKTSPSKLLNLPKDMWEVIGSLLPFSDVCHIELTGWKNFTDVSGKKINTYIVPMKKASLLHYPLKPIEIEIGVSPAIKFWKQESSAKILQDNNNANVVKTEINLEQVNKSIKKLLGEGKKPLNPFINLTAVIETQDDFNKIFPSCTFVKSLSIIV